MKTQCIACGKVFASPEKAESHHRASHLPVQRTVGGTIDGKFVKRWPRDAKGLYRNGQTWGDYVSS